jgi:hypothetical protein
VLSFTDDEVHRTWLGDECRMLTRLCQLFKVDLAAIRAQLEGAYQTAQQAAKDAAKAKVTTKPAKAKKAAKKRAGDVKRAKAKGAAS